MIVVIGSFDGVPYDAAVCNTPDEANDLRARLLATKFYERVDLVTTTPAEELATYAEQEADDLKDEPDPRD